MGQTMKTFEGQKKWFKLNGKNNWKPMEGNDKTRLIEVSSKEGCVAARFT